MSSLQALAYSSQLLKSKTANQAIYGVGIALAAIIIATALSSYVQFGPLSFESFVQAQKTNSVLWVLDAMPLLYAFWGQYIGSITSYQAGAVLADQINKKLRIQNAVLKDKITHDSTTGLPNRILFYDRVSQAISLSQRDKHKFAIILLDIDRFKEINNTLGHLTGDKLLNLIGMRLQDILRESDTLSRLGGDEFAILLPVIGNEVEAAAVTQKIHRSLVSPFKLDDLTLDVQASAGVVIYPENGLDVVTLIQRADIAMYAAKQGGKDTVTYQAKLDQHSEQRLTLPSELRQAIENDDLILHYQPQIDVSNKHSHVAEVLVRWQHQKHGLVSPDDFIGLAERTGLIKPLTYWVLDHAFQQGAVWHNSNLKISLAVNLSAKCLLDLEFPEVLARLFDQSDFPIEYLLLEVTETAVMTDPMLALEILNSVAQLGVRISIDDFGTGHSSLSYLKQLPVSELKIDKTFVTEMLTNENDSAIVQATIDLAHNLGLEVVAEGIENKATLEKLESLNCDKFQGYYFSKPVSSQEFQTWFQAK